jgi:glyoxylase-like metal-dependent hydrolase (beta-lactamase superfamily II)
MWIKGTEDVSNIYIIKRFDAVMLIDPSYNLETILEKTQGYKIQGILLTHAHHDHMGLIGKFDCPIYLHRADYQLFINDDLNGYNEYKIERPYQVKDLFIKFVDDETLIPFMDGSIKVIHTPGHTKGSVCYLYRDSLYTGDTLFKDGIGRTDLPSGSSAQLHRSLKKLFSIVSAKTKVYPGHDEPSTIYEIKLKNKTVENIVKH